jgi:hypothetical protein
LTLDQPAAAGSVTAEPKEEAEAPPPPVTAPAPAKAAKQAPAPGSERPVSKGVFYAGAAATALAAGFVTWSGVSTLNAKSDFLDDRTSEKREAVSERERRTNILLGITIVLGVGTAATGVFFVDWKTGNEGPHAERALVAGFGGTL